jgi:tetratricopeptide (TPR) repeat protein
MRQSHQRLRDAAFEVLTKPRIFFLGLPSFIHTWCLTRSWKSVVFAGWPVWLLLILLGLQTATSSNQSQLLNGFANRLKQSVDDGENLEALVEAGASEATSLELSTIAYRLMASDHSSKHANYFVALQFASAGQQETCRAIMSRIAGDGPSSFPQAHAWLALDRLNRIGIRDKQETEEVLTHLEVIEGTKYTSPQLRSVQAELYSSVGERSKALAIYDGLRTDSFAFAVKAAEFATQAGDERRSRRALNSAREFKQALKRSDLQQFSNQILLARLASLEGDTEAAIQAANAAVSGKPSDPVARRLLSDAYIASYEGQASEVADLGLLDLAMKADSSNPRVAKALFELQDSYQQIDDEVIQGLLANIQQGKASAISHHFLGNIAIQEGRMEEAITHLRIALQSAPRSVAVLNNLALAIASTFSDDKERIDESLVLIRRALSYQPNSTMLQDTLADILVLAGETIEAIRIYEQLIASDASLESIRPKLAAAYRKVGLKELAAKYELER